MKATSRKWTSSVHICVIMAFSLVPRKGLDPEVLPDPLEEQLNLPSPPVDCGDGLSRNSEAVGQEYANLARFRVVDLHAQQFPGIRFVCVLKLQFHGVVVHARFFIWREVLSGELEPCVPPGLVTKKAPLP